MTQPFTSSKSHPHIFEINAWIFIRRLSHKYGRPLTLATIPLDEWKQIAGQGFDYVWLMGVWQRSPEARKRAIEALELREQYDQALPGWKQADVPGSPYAIYNYAVDPHIGTNEELLEIKKRLNQLGMGLILDFVPNHLALDNPRTLTCPEMFIPHGSGTEAEKSGLFFKTEKGMYLAHGRDPYFAPWRDTVQVNFISPAARKAACDDLLHIAAHADGVRCDMAMLALTDVFQETWGAFLGDMPGAQKEYWQEIIQQVKKSCPDFIFIAEAYWDMEWKLQQLGFHFTYDKILYDRLLHNHAWDISGHLKAEAAYQSRSLRFIENHDEARAMAAFGPEKSQAAAAIIMTIPGARFIHDGQTEGKSIRLPVQLGREPKENLSSSLTDFYTKLFHFSANDILHKGTWTQLFPFEAWDGNKTCACLLAWKWQYENDCRLVVINYSNIPAQGRLRLELANVDSLLLRDALSNTEYARDVQETNRFGLYVALEPWQSHLFEFSLKIKSPLKKQSGT